VPKGVGPLGAAGGRLAYHIDADGIDRERGGSVAQGFHPCMPGLITFRVFFQDQMTQEEFGYSEKYAICSS
jgi:hypothetical protein